MAKGDSQHASQHQHGIQVKGEPLAPRTVEQRVADIEALICLESGGESVAAILAEAKARRAKIAEEDAKKSEPEEE